MILLNVNNTIPEFDIISENSSINSKDSESNSDEDTKKNSIDNNIETQNKIKELIDIKFIDFRKKIIDKIKGIWWPIKVKYAGKTYYPMTKRNYLFNNKCTIIRYYCVNHYLNTKNKKIMLK